MSAAAQMALQDDIFEAVVTVRRADTATVVVLELAPAEAAPFPHFAAGAHVDLHLPGDLIRPYSLCSDPGREGDYKVAIALERESRGGSAAAHRLRTGDRLRVSSPRNHFPLSATQGRSVLIGGGIGVTPLLAMAYELSRRGASFELHYCVRSTDQVALHAELSDPALAPFVNIYFDDAPKAERFAADRVLAGAGPDDHLYLCGPEGFMYFIAGAAEYMGWAPEHIHMELFTRKVDLTGDPFELRTLRSGLSVEVASGESIAQVLRRNGVYVRVSCENGLCGSCLLPVVEGVPDHRDQYLSDAERAAGRELTTCCSRSLTSVLVLDV